MRKALHRLRPTYSLMDEMLASPVQPTPQASQVHQLTRMYGGLHSIETAARPSVDDWRVCSDAVNLMETLVASGVVQDTSGLLADAVFALSVAGRRHVKSNAPIRLDGEGIQAVRAVLEDYRALLAVLPHRTMVQCHRATERRLRDILAGRRQAHDVEVMAL